MSQVGGCECSWQKKPAGQLESCRWRLSPKQAVGPLRVLGYPLAGWGSFYGPIGPNPADTLKAGLRHIHETQRELGCA